MKTKITLSISFVAIVVLFWAGVESSSGKVGYAGSLGEQTCSAQGCHGAGNVGGLADNAGSGSVTISASPAFVNQQYVAGQTYAISVTVAEGTKLYFGFGFEALDNSANTNPKTNNSVGTIAITDANTTRKAQYFNTGRVNVIQADGSIPSNTSGSQSFTFDWTAPQSGTVNLYATGNATNGNGQADAGDNIYKTSMQISASTVTQVSEVGTGNFSLKLFPNPAKDNAAVVYSLNGNSNVSVNLLSFEGKLVDVISYGNKSEGTYTANVDLSKYSSGIYFVQIKTDESTQTQKLLVQ